MLNSGSAGWCVVIECKTRCDWFADYCLEAWKFGITIGNFFFFFFYPELTIFGRKVETVKGMHIAISLL